MKSLYAILMLLMVSPIAAQSIEKFSIDSGGASSIVNGIQILYSIGEVAIQEISTPTVSVSEGFINSNTSETLGTNDFQFSSSNISIYPNPTRQYINITTDVLLTKIELYDVLGKIIFQSKLVDNPIKVSAFERGVYFLKLYKNNKSVVKRVVIE